jgi:hypothetical protein
MHSSISSSETIPCLHDEGALRRYALVTGALILAGLMLMEWFVRNSVASAKPEALSQQFVAKVLTARSSDIVAGDSHVGLNDYHQPYAFIGLGGITSRELERTLRAYFRNKPVGKVMLELGPQQMAPARLVEWRALARNSLTRQVLPVYVYLFEPELITLVERRVDGWFVQVLGFGIAEFMQPDDGNQAARLRAEPVPYASLPERGRRRRSIRQAARQQPATDFVSHSAWHARRRIVQWLVAKGGRVCVVTTPVSAEYEQVRAEAAAQWNRHEQALEALAREFSVPYVDYRTLGLGSLPADFFVDPDHMAPAGHAAYWPAAEKACFSGSP